MNIIIILSIDFQQQNEERYIQKIVPERGTAIIFNHDVLHSGRAVKKGDKFVVKTEIIFQRMPSSLISEIVSFIKQNILYI